MCQNGKRMHKLEESEPCLNLCVCVCVCVSSGCVTISL